MIIEYKDNVKPLHKAVKRGHLEMVKFLVDDALADINCVTKDGYTPLHYACDGVYPKIIKFLRGWEILILRVTVYLLGERET